MPWFNFKQIDSAIIIECLFDRNNKIWADAMTRLYSTDSYVVEKDHNDYNLILFHTEVVAD